MQEVLILLALNEVWLPTYSPGVFNSRFGRKLNEVDSIKWEDLRADGAICLEAGKTYKLRVIGPLLVDVSDYCFDDLVVTTKAIAQAVSNGKLLVGGRDAPAE